MPAPYRIRNALLAAKTETTPGVDAVPGLSDAILCEEPTIRWDVVSIDTREITGDLDVGASIPAGGSLGLDVTVPIRGSGTASTPPRVGPLLRAAALAQTITASAVTGTAQGGTSSTIKLAATASATSHTYTGMLITITGGTGAGQSRLMRSYIGSTRDAYVMPNWTTAPDATSTYSIAANVQYRPGTVEEPCTIYHYQHHADGINSKLIKAIGAVATGSIELAVRDVPRIRLQARAQLTAATDVARPGTPVYEQTQPPAWIGAPTIVGTTAVSMARLTIDIGNNVQMIDDPNQSYGFDRPLVAARAIEVRLAIPVDTESALNLRASWEAGTIYPISTYWGATAGNRVALVVPDARFSSWEYRDNNGQLYYEARARLKPDSEVPFALTFF